MDLGYYVLYLHHGFGNKRIVRLERTINEYLERAQTENEMKTKTLDTPILIRDSSFSEWGKRYFAKYENGIVYAWSNGTTSWSGDRCTPWKLAKLPDKEQ